MNIIPSQSCKCNVSNKRSFGYHFSTFSYVILKKVVLLPTTIFLTKTLLNLNMRATNLHTFRICFTVKVKLLGGGGGGGGGGGQQIYT